MERSTRRKLEMAARVRDFSRAHPFSDPSHQAVAARLEDRFALAQGLVVQEQAGRADRSAATRHRKNVRRALESELVRYLTRVGEVAGRDQPDLAGRFRGPNQKVSNAIFLARAWDLLNLARANRDLLGNHGLALGQVDELASALTRFEEATVKANAGRRAHVGARAELLSLTGEVMEVVGLLDVLNKTRFRDQADVLAEWESAANVGGPVRTRGEPQGSPEKTA